MFLIVQITSEHILCTATLPILNFVIIVLLHWYGPSLPWAITFMHVCTLATKSIYALSAKGKYTNPVVSSCFYHILLYDSIEIRNSYLFIYKLKMNTLWEHT